MADVKGNFDSYAAIIDDIKDRTPWEIRQTQFYKMRHDGLRRRMKPYSGASDLHFPLCDSLLEKMKSFYVQKLYATGSFASFTSLLTKHEDFSDGASFWFDYKLKRKSNFQREVICAIDYMLMGGRGMLKMYWDEGKKELCFDAVDPIYTIQPKQSDSVQDSDRLVHVIHLTPEQYKRNKSFPKQDDGFIKTITGRGAGVAGVSAGSVDKEIQKWLREGIVYGQNDDQIVVWEIYEKEEDGRILVSTYSPLQPHADKWLRKPFYLPYKQGVFDGQGAFPFVSFQREIKDKGWFSPRGLVEINASFEQYGNKTWNAISDWLDFFGRPTLRAERDVGGNVTNIKMAPGQVLPFGITPNEAAKVPPDLNQELVNVRAMAEYRTQVPDLSGPAIREGKRGEGVRSATEINAVVGQAGMSDDMRAITFDLDLSSLYEMAWSIYIQKDRTDLAYVLNQELFELPEDALHADYMIVPNGSSDAWNRQMQLQKASALMQYSANNPYSKPGEAWKIFLELMEPRWVKRIYVDAGAVTQSQASKQAMETAAIMLGQPVSIDQGDDDKTHIQELNGFVGQRMQTQEGFDQRNASLLLQHYGQHGQALKQKRDPQAKDVEKASVQFLDYLSGVVNGTVPESQTPGNVVPMQQPQQPGPTPADQINQQKLQLQAQAQQAKQQFDQVKLATKTTLDKQKVGSVVANALANLKKSGVNITNQEINYVMQEMGLPSLPQQVVKEVAGGGL